MVQVHASDEYEQQLLDDVREFGWQVVMVSDREDGPAFVYSVGMCHTLGHPEILMIGLGNCSAMGRIVNRIGKLVREGMKLTDGSVSNAVLDGRPLAFRSVDPRLYSEHVGFAMWFYRPDDFPVLQCIWPDRNGVYPWQSECELAVKACQPILAQSQGESI